MYKYCIPLKYHTGTRAIRSHGPLEGVYINGAEQGLDYHDADNYTLYVSPYLIVNNDRFTKHYYAGTQRIASKVGSGDFYNVYGVNGFHLTAGQKDYEEHLVQMEEGVKQYYRQNGIPPGVPTQKGSNADPYQTGVALPNVPLGNYDVPSGWPTNVRFNPPGDVPGPPVQFESEEMGDPGAGFGFESDHTYEGDWFFFHTDHLGSTSYLTDTAGNVSQFVCYTPYGEAIVDEHLTTYENPFKFSGKELDDITGLYDHGARSRNPVTTLWYGVDPRYVEFPEMSPFAYCHGNPVRLVDPDGKADEELHGSNKTSKIESISNRINKISTSDSPKEIAQEAIGVIYDGISILTAPIQGLTEITLDYTKSDAISLYVQGSVAIGGGVNGGFEVGYVKGDGYFVAGSYGVGTGVDASIGGGIKTSVYSGDNSPTINSYEGGGSSLGIGIGFIDLGFSTSDDNKWTSVNTGISAGTPFGATFSHTNTSIIFK